MLHKKKTKKIMNQRKIREFERLLDRTDKLTDKNTIKENLVVIEQKLSELRNENLITSEQDAEYFNILTSINQRTSQAKEKARPRKTQKIEEQDEEKTLSEEQEKHKQLTKEYLKLTENLKESVAKVGDEMKKDQEAISNVHNIVDKTLNHAEDAQDELDERSKAKLGLRAWIWLIKVILVFALVQFIFL